MGDTIQRRELETIEQREAMRQPARHRTTLALREPKTVSDLARELHINGNGAHHVIGTIGGTRLSFENWSDKIGRRAR